MMDKMIRPEAIQYDHELCELIAEMGPEELETFEHSCLGTYTAAHSQTVPVDVIPSGARVGRRSGILGFTLYFVS